MEELTWVQWVARRLKMKAMYCNSLRLVVVAVECLVIAAGWLCSLQQVASRYSFLGQGQGDTLYRVASASPKITSLGEQVTEERVSRGYSSWLVEERIADREMVRWWFPANILVKTLEGLLGSAQ